MTQKRALGRPPNHLIKQPTKEKIQDHSQLLFLNYSYQEISMEDVAQAANVTKATVYYYFPSKSRLYTETMIRMLQRIQQQVRDTLDIEQSFYKNLNEVAIGFLSATIHLDMDALTHGTKTALDQEDWLEMNQVIEGIYDTLEKGFQTAMEKGQIPANFSSAFSSKAFFSLLNIGKDKQLIKQQGEVDIEDITNDIIRFFQKGISQ